MVKGVASPCLRVQIADVVQQVEGVHKVEDRGLELVEDFLIQRIEVFAVVDN